MNGGNRRKRVRTWIGKAPAESVRQAGGILLKCDAIRLLQSMRSESAELVFLDPPFNLGKQYGRRNGRADRLAVGDYRSFLSEVLQEASRILKPGGAVYLYHLPKWAAEASALLSSAGLEFRHWIAISMKSSYARGDFLYPAHYALLYFTKGAPRTFIRPKIPVATCRHCSGHIKDYGGYKEYVKDGINLSDVWDDLSPVRHQKYKTRRENELPLKLTRRVVSMSGSEGSLLVDPFAGAGASIVAAVESNMRFIAGDSDRAAINAMCHRLTELKSGKVLRTS